MTEKHQKITTFKGYVIKCTDLDSRDEFHIEISLNTRIEPDNMQEVVNKHAAKHNLVLLSGNTFEFEILCESGRVIKETVTREVLSGVNKESAKLLNNYKHG